MNTNKLFAAILILLGSSSQAVHYNAKPLEQLPVVTDNAQCVSFNHRVFNNRDCKRFLGRDKVISRGYQPIQLSLTNNTNKHLMLSLANFSVPCIPADIVAENLHFNTVSRVVGWSIGALFFWPLFIPAVIEGVESPRANRILENDYYNKALTNQIIKPYSTIEGLIFVPCQSFYREFSLSLIDSQNNQRFMLSTSYPLNELTRKSEYENVERKG